MDSDHAEAERATPALGQRPCGDVTLSTGRSVKLREMSRRDVRRLITFAERLPSRTRITLAIDLAGQAASRHTILAYRDGTLTGYASLHCGEAPWTRYVGETCVIVGSTRQDAETADLLGRAIVRRALAIGLRKIIVRSFNDVATRAIFEQLGFSVEGILADHLADEAGHTFDVLIMSRAVECRSLVVARDVSAIAEAVTADLKAPVQDSPPNSEPPPGALPASAMIDLRPHIVDLDATTADEVAPACEETPPLEFMRLPVPSRDAPDPPTDRVSDEETTDARARAAFGQATTRVGTDRRARAAAAAVIVVMLVLASAGLYWTKRPTSSRAIEVLGASARPVVPSPTAPVPSFASTRTGSGGVFLPAIGPTIAVRVTIDPRVTSPWFWCFESSFGLPLAAHFCAGGDPSKPSAYSLATQGVIHIDPAWPADARYFVQMYCENLCVWHVETTPR